VASVNASLGSPLALAQMQADQGASYVWSSLKYALGLLWSGAKALTYVVTYTLSCLSEGILRGGFFARLKSFAGKTHVEILRQYREAAMSLQRQYNQIGTGRPFFEMCVALGAPLGVSSGDILRTMGPMMTKPRRK